MVQAIEKYTAELEAQQKQAQQTELQLGEQRALLRNKTADLTVAQAAIGTDLQVTSADLLAEKAHLNQIANDYQITPRGRPSHRSNQSTYFIKTSN